MPNSSDQLTKERIEKRAYQLYEERGRSEGHALEDWLDAERELTQPRGRNTPREHRQAAHGRNL